jgi:hypothetical protein
VVLIHASNVAACVDTDAAQFPGTLPQPAVVRKLSTAPADVVIFGFLPQQDDDGIT